MVDITIDVIDRGTFRADLNFMVEGAVLAGLANQNPDIDFVEFPVYNLVIDHPDATILWDTGIHHESGEGHWPDWMFDAFPAEDAADHRLDDDLEDNGWSIDDIDCVAMTHLHVDHSGGLGFFDGTDVPIYVHEDEIKYAYYSMVTDEASDAYLLDDLHLDLDWEIIHRDRTELFEGIEFIRSPGHTPGLLSTKVELDDGNTVIFTGDEVYMSANYYEEQPLGAGLLWDKQKWFDSLHTLKELERRHNAEMVFGHPPDQIDEIRSGWS